MAEDEKCEYLERIYIVPLSGSKHMPPDYGRARHVINTIKKYVSRHMKVGLDKVWVDPKLNEAVWARGAKHIPSKIKVKAIRFEDCLVEVDLETEEEPEKKKEKKKEPKKEESS
ncbi:MAG: 50S ribosomal protein L31e [Thermoplasmata archaeon]|nr:50S ribosomal protein L31e [Thermoplasmata archaeon]